MSIVPYAGRPFQAVPGWHIGSDRKRGLEASVGLIWALFQQGHDTLTIAERLNLSEATVYNRLAKARARA